MAAEGDERTSALKRRHALDETLTEPAPSDFEQAKVRVIIVSLVLAVSLANSHNASYAAVAPQPYVIAAAFYFVCSLLALLGWRIVDETERAASRTRISFRLLCLFSDISALTAFTALAGELAILLLPVYLSAIIGYGFRFGTPYLIATLIASVGMFFVATAWNASLRQQPLIVVAQFIAMLFIPVYAAALLLRYKRVLTLLRDEADSRARIIGIMSHEFRAPLASLLMLLEPKGNLRGSNDPVSGSDRQITLACLERLLHVANRIVEFEVPESGTRAAPNTEGTSFFRDIATCVRVASVLAEQRGLKLDWTIENAVPVWFGLKSSTAQELVLNILDNGVKHASAGTVTLSVRLEVDRGRKIVVLVVRNCRRSCEVESMANHGAARAALGRRPNAGLGLEITRMQLAHLGGSLSTEVDGQEIVNAIRLPVPEVATQIYEVTREWISAPIAISRALTEAEREAFVAHKVFPIDFQAFGVSLERYLAFEPTELIVANCCAGEVSGLLAALPPTKRARLVVLPLAGPAEPANNWVQEANFWPDTEIGSSLNALRSFNLDEHYVPESTGTLLPDRAVLVVDDNPLGRIALSRILESEGATVETASSFDEASAMIVSGAFDIVLADFLLGDRFGDELSDLVKGSSADAACIIVSAAVTSELVERCKRKRIAAVFEKPVSRDDILSALSQFTTSPDHPPPRRWCNTAVGRVQPDPLALSNFRASCSSEKEYERLLELLEDSTFEDLFQCYQSIRNGDNAAVERRLHSIKGAWSVVGMAEFGDRLASVIAEICAGRRDVCYVAQVCAGIRSVKKYLSSAS